MDRVFPGIVNRNAQLASSIDNQNPLIISDDNDEDNIPS